MFALLLAASLMAAIERRPPASIARYLWAVLWEIPFLWTADAVWGDWSIAYAVVYVAFTLVILATIVRIAYDSVRTRRWRLRAAVITGVLAVCTARMTLRGAQSPLGGTLAISLVEGFVLAWAGTLTAFAAPYTRRPDLTFALGVFWSVQAAFSFGWTINWTRWQAINWLVPPALAIACFTYLWWRLGAAPPTLPPVRPR